MSARVLLVDDEEAVRRNFRALLEDAGHKVIEASNGAEGLDAFERERPDIVLTDLRMRWSKDGLELVSAIRERSDEVPVVVVSGSGTLQDAVDAIRRGAWDYLVKPVQLGEELLVAIDRNLERSRLLQENRSYRANLEEMVTERTASLLAARRANEALEARLMRAQKLECLGLLAGGIAHDFNNVLVAIQCGVEDLRRARPVGCEEALALIDEGMKQAAELTRQIFVFAGRAPSNPVACDLRALVRGMDKLLRSALKSEVALRTNLADAPPIRADPTQIRQIVMNLVLNGAESITGGGSVGIRVGVVELAGEASPGATTTTTTQLVRPVQNGAHVALAIEDSGSGMDEATLRRIGDPFFTTKARGQGLGLTTVIGIVRGLGGALTVDSAVGHGTRFTVAFPTVPVVFEAAPPRSILARG